MNPHFCTYWRFPVFSPVSQPLSTQHAPAFVPSRRNVVVLLTVGAAISALCGYFFLSRPASGKIDKSIAVLPFGNFNEDKETEHFANGASSSFLPRSSGARAKWQDATANFEKAASLSPGDPIVIEDPALTYEAIRDFPATAKTFDRAVTLVPHSFEAKSLRARVEMEWKGDLTLMRTLLASLPPDFESFGMVALARFNLPFFERNFDEALAVLSGRYQSHFLQRRFTV
jgi:hypothetical protein